MVTVAILFVFGSIIGSFLNVVIYRLPLIIDGRHEGRYDLVYPRSHCPKCSHRIKALENIPLVSYVLLQGRCSHCQAAIPPRYPLVELTAALAAAGLIWHFGTSWTALAAFVFLCTGICIALIDIEHLLIPDVLTYPLIAAGLVANGAGIFTSFANAGLGSVGGFVSLWAVYQGILLATKREAMGYGDFKLFAAIGAWLGWQVLPAVILIASIVGLLYAMFTWLTGNRQSAQPIPFGPFLAVSGWVSLVERDNVMALFLA